MYTLQSGADPVGRGPEGEEARLLRLTGRPPDALTSGTGIMAPDLNFGFLAQITRIEGVDGEALLPLVAYGMDGLEPTTIDNKRVWVRVRGQASDYFYVYDDVVILFWVSDPWVLSDVLEQLP